MSTRMQPKDRKEQILLAAVELSKSSNYMRVTRDQIAEKAGVAMGLVTYYFSTMAQLRRDVMRYAVRCEVLEIIAQGLALGDTQARKAPEDVRKKAVATL